MYKDDIPPPITANVQGDDIPPPIPANVQDNDIPPPIPANVQDDDIPPPIPTNVQDDDIPPPIPANVQDDDIPPPIPANVQDDDIPPPIPAKTNKTSDTTKQMSNDEEITGGLTSPFLTSTIEVKPILVSPQHQIGYHNEGPLLGHIEEDSPVNYHDSKYYCRSCYERSSVIKIVIVN